MKFNKTGSYARNVLEEFTDIQLLLDILLNSQLIASICEFI